MAAPPLDSPCDGPVTYPGDTKILVKSSKERSGPTLNKEQETRLTVQEHDDDDDDDDDDLVQ